MEVAVGGRGPFGLDLLPLPRDQVEAVDLGPEAEVELLVPAVDVEPVPDDAGGVAVPLGGRRARGRHRTPVPGDSVEHPGHVAGLLVVPAAEQDDQVAVGRDSVAVAQVGPGSRAWNRIIQGYL